MHRPHNKHKWGLRFHVAITAALAFMTLSGLFRYWSHNIVSFRDNEGGAESTSRAAFIGTTNGPHEINLLARKIAYLQGMLGRSMQKNVDIPNSDCGVQLKAERLNHSNLLIEIVWNLDKMLEIIQSTSNLKQGHDGIEIKELKSDSKPEPNSEPELQPEEDEEEDEENGSLHTSMFHSSELKKYTEPKENRHGRKNFMGAMAAYPTVGLACISDSLKAEQYMLYNVSGMCPDDWPVAQELMVQGCDPPPRRRCLAARPQGRGRSRVTPRLPVLSALWSLPDDGSLRWTHYKCKGFACLTSKNITNRGFHKCAECFNLEAHESMRWIANNNNTAEFSVYEVLSLKAPGEIKIGLDFSPGTGTFAALMRSRNVTIATATLNLGAPFNEMIALRGLIPLYISVNQRLPFFDNTLDIIHTTLFLDGWIDVEFLEFIVFDWDRVLRPGGLLWIDRFFCSEKDVKEYIAVFEKLRYAKLLWTVEPKLDKNGGEVFLSAVLEKTVNT
ncbi:hypothetical protein SUGI_0182370 [Cryptomeria japonica]|uniref:probable methyltransferase At1g29790 n=1 Tax=Cryptomeria japonica TaxID=3369 RepID=UPI002408CE8B|nr:probable methyltransferase At1g29790 [Cryptomeria japonica]GLJ12026.1 hypothetical protein SUGI_0182370 [Cryptomeria japonica]